MVHDAPIPATTTSAATSEHSHSAPKPAQPAPAALPQPVAKDPVHSVAPTSPATSTTVAPSIAASMAAPGPVLDLATATRVKALHNFEPADAGELAFEKGDVIKVVDRTHKDWWKGQLKGRTGIFPVNYVVCIIVSGFNLVTD